jgi:hypothetical protein
MSIDLTTEELICLRDAAKILPARRKGKRPHVSCLYRWTTHGCRGVVLDAVNVGGTRCTSREALGRFIEGLSDLGSNHHSASVGRPLRQERVERELDSQGIT